MKRALVLLLLVTACGGSSGGDSGNPKADYLKKAEAVCAQANTEIAAAKKNTPAGIAEVPPYVHKLLDLAKQTLEDLSLLTPPADDAVQVKAKLLDPLGQQLADARTFATKVDAAAAKNDSATLTQLVFNPPTKTRVDIAWMKSYGFKACVTAADTGAASK
ncbi:MAG: hypothetical protein QOE05_59 [Actinomycetota bacterium]|jgi:malonyl CoA-acyl carrier protein transacylase|nr:hypothetical protein [Actinomycetota bacterium]